MKFRTRHGLAAIVAASCLAIPAPASAMPCSPPGTTESDAAQSAHGPATDRTDAAQAGTNETTTTSTFPPATFRGGDDPVTTPA